MFLLQSERKTRGDPRKRLKRVGVGKVANLADERLYFRGGQHLQKMRTSIEDKVGGFTIVRFKKPLELSKRLNHGRRTRSGGRRGGGFLRKRTANCCESGVERCRQGVERGRDGVICLDGRFDLGGDFGKCGRTQVCSGAFKGMGEALCGRRIVGGKGAANI